jgi:hypothetical protein
MKKLSLERESLKSLTVRTDVKTGRFTTTHTIMPFCPTETCSPSMRFPVLCTGTL